MGDVKKTSYYYASPYDLEHKYDEPEVVISFGAEKKLMSYGDAINFAHEILHAAYTSIERKRAALYNGRDND